MKASIVLGTQFGDEGKGSTVAYLSEKYSEKYHDSGIVVRFSGGQQCGHTVVKKNIRHIFSNFGSGTLENLPSYFTEHCTIYPKTIFNEFNVLREKGFNPLLYVNPLTKITTPYDVAYNRITELKNNHGSCGLGIGATMKRNETTGYKLFAIDTISSNIFNQKLKNIKNYYESIIDIDDLDLFNKISDEENIIFGDLLGQNFTIKPYDFLTKFRNLIFEGSQGILLDMDHGIFPNVTYSNTTSKNAIEICNKLGINDINIYYVTRCYQTRHGHGWMSNNQPIELIKNSLETNVYNEFQKEFKIGEIDYDLLKYSLSVDNIYSNDCKKNLVVTCLDQRPNFKFDYSKLKFYFENKYESYSDVYQNITLI